jgi:OmpA-OmpF porin, OOP family
MNCSRCGAELAEGSAFCTRCGAPRTASSGSSVARRFCTGCGAPLAAQAKFCTKCGAQAAVMESRPALEPTQNADSPRPTPAEVPHITGVVAPPIQAGTPTARSGSAIPKIAIIGVTVVAMVLVTAVAGIWYAVHRVRQKAAQIEAAYTLAQEAQKQGPSPGSSSPANPTASSNSGSASGQAAPNGYTIVNGQLVPAPASVPSGPPKPVPMVAVAATGNQAHDWALEYERTEGGPDADLVVRTGDINNLSFGWPAGFDPFSGQSTPPHQWPDPNHIPANAPDGTDRVMIGSAVIPGLGDGYSGALNDCVILKQLPSGTPSSAKVAAACKKDRQITMPQPIVLLVGAVPAKIDSVLVQIFADDFQPVPLHSHFQVSLNGTRIPSFEQAINALDQSGPIGKLLTLKLLPEYWPLLKSGTVKLLIDDPTTHVPDGYAVDFVRILINPHNFKYQVSLAAKVTDADKHTPIAGANVTAALESTTTDRLGKCELKGIPAGLVVATASAPGYDEGSVTVDLPSGQTGEADIQLHRHEETTAALEKSIEQTGSAAIYGIHFDTDSATIRADSLPALNAVLALINNHPGSNWIISGHTDNQGSAVHNQPLSERRAASVIAWLGAHGVEKNRLVSEGFGATRPVADNSTPSGRALNRRVEVALAK